MKPSFLKLDLRSLALFRVLIGIILFFDLYSRIINVTSFYADSGVLPRVQLIADFSNPWFFSVYNMAGKPLLIYVLCAVAGFCYLAFTLGYRARLFSVLTWIFYVSFTARAPIISHGGDDLLRLALFWMMFLPSGAYYSVDAALRKSTDPIPKSIFHIGTAAFMAQLLVMYILTALLKDHPIWKEEGTAIYFSLQLDQFITPFGAWFRELPLGFLKFMTHCVYYTELLVPFLVLIPIGNAYFRLFAITAFVGFHMGLFSVFYLGTFPWICAAYWLAFLPTAFWDFFEPKLKARQQTTTIYYDGDCGYCFKMLNLIKMFFLLPYVKVEKCQDHPKYFALMKKEVSWLVQTGSEPTQLRYDAFISLLKVSPFKFLAPLLNISPIKKLGNAVYKAQATRRPMMASLLNHLHPVKISTSSHWLSQFAVIFCIFIAGSWNYTLFKGGEDAKVDGLVYQAGSILRLHQHWNMFAPYPWKEDGWYVVEGDLPKTSDDPNEEPRTWDIFNDQPVTWEKPKDVASTFKDTLWRKYLINIWLKDYNDYRLYYGRYLCREWNNNHPKNQYVRTFKIYYMLEVSKEPGEEKSIPSKELIWSHDCEGR